MIYSGPSFMNSKRQFILIGHQKVGVLVMPPTSEEKPTMAKITTAMEYLK